MLRVAVLTFADACELSAFRSGFGVEQAQCEFDEVRCDEVQLLAVPHRGQHERAHLHVQRQPVRHLVSQRVRVELMSERLQLLHEEGVQEVQRRLLVPADVRHGQQQLQAERGQRHLTAAHQVQQDTAEERLLCDGRLQAHERGLLECQQRGESGCLPLGRSRGCRRVVCAVAPVQLVEQAEDGGQQPALVHLTDGAQVQEDDGEVGAEEVVRLAQAVADGGHQRGVLVGAELQVRQVGCQLHQTGQSPLQLHQLNHAAHSREGVRRAA